MVSFPFGLLFIIDSKSPSLFYQTTTQKLTQTMACLNWNTWLPCRHFRLLFQEDPMVKRTKSTCDMNSWQRNNKIPFQPETTQFILHVRVPLIEGKIKEISFGYLLCGTDWIKQVVLSLFAIGDKGSSCLNWMFNKNQSNVYGH